MNWEDAQEVVALLCNSEIRTLSSKIFRLLSGRLKRELNQDRFNHTVISRQPYAVGVKTVKMHQKED